MDTKVALLLSTLSAAGGAATGKLANDITEPKAQIDTVTLAHFPLTNEYVFQSHASLRRDDGSYFVEEPGPQVNVKDDKNRAAIKAVFDLANRARSNPKEKF